MHRFKCITAFAPNNSHQMHYSFHVVERIAQGVRIPDITVLYLNGPVVEHSLPAGRVDQATHLMAPLQ